MIKNNGNNFLKVIKNINLTRIFNFIKSCFQNMGKAYNQDYNTIV